MSTYTLRQANSWFNIETLFNIGTVFGIYSGDDRPASPGNRADELKTSSQEVINPTKPPKKKPVDAESESTTTPTIETDSEV